MQHVQVRVLLSGMCGIYRQVVFPGGGFSMQGLHTYLDCLTNLNCFEMPDKNCNARPDPSLWLCIVCTETYCMLLHAYLILWILECFLLGSPIRIHVSMSDCGKSVLDVKKHHSMHTLCTISMIRSKSISLKWVNYMQLISWHMECAGGNFVCNISHVDALIEWLLRVTWPGNIHAPSLADKCCYIYTQ